MRDRTPVPYRIAPAFVAALLLLPALALAQEEDSAAVPAERNSAVWVQQPLLTGLFALHGGVFASIGANLELAPHRVFVFELTGAGLNASPSRLGQVGFAAGYLHPIHRDRHIGLYFSPKLFTVLSSEESLHSGGEEPADVVVPGTSFEAQGGGDLVLQLESGPLFIATMVGGTVGYCFDCPDGELSAFGGLPLWRFLFATGPGRRHRPALTLNFNLLRVGYAW